MPVICSLVKPWEILKIYTKFRKLNLPDFKPNIEEKNISILIGIYISFIKVNVIRPANGNLDALESKLGWILTGTCKTNERI